MGRIKNILKQPKIIILIITLVLAIVAIHPNFLAEGAAIRAVAKNSSAAIAGIEPPAANSAPMSRERIVRINTIPIRTVEDYYNTLADIEPGVTIQLKTTKGLYRVVAAQKQLIIPLNETIKEEVLVEEYDYELNQTVNKTRIIEKQKTRTEYLDEIDLGLNVYDAPTTNIRKGLDLQGGTRVLLQPAEKVSDETMELVLDNMKQRLNVYGLTDVVVRSAADLSGNQYLLVEIAGANEEEVRELLAKQGKFEAKVGNKTVFLGGNDITYVCRSADCSGIDPYYGCGSLAEGGYSCRFRFAITLSPLAAQRQADATADLQIIKENDDEFLSERLSLYLDDELFDELRIGAELKGKAVTDIQISGGGQGNSEQEALQSTLSDMKRLQTVLVTGSLPVKLDIVKTDSISPVLGKEFINNSIFLGFVAGIAVIVVLILFYRKLKISIPIVITLLSEIIIILGFASLIGWNIDLAAIAGIIIAIGTGVDDQIVITDEILSGKKNEEILDWKKRIKKAFFIVLAAYFTTVVAMIPLLFAGAGLLKGFAITTIIGVTSGVLITRPAFAVLMQELLKR